MSPCYQMFEECASLLLACVSNSFKNSDSTHFVKQVYGGVSYEKATTVFSFVLVFCSTDDIRNIISVDTVIHWMQSIMGGANDIKWDTRSVSFHTSGFICLEKECKRNGDNLQKITIKCHL